MKKVALVTGGARGIGFGISEKLAAEKINLAICGTKDEKDVSAPLEQLRQYGIEVFYCRCNISDSEMRAEMLSDIKRRFGRLDALINNAGIAPSERKDILEAGEESFDKLIQTNLKGPYFLTQAAAKMMIEQKSIDSSFAGTIINVSSVSASVASVNRGDYCISKAGVSMASKLWAARLAEYGIQVYEIRPGIIKTDMTSGVQTKYDKLIEEGLLLEKRWGLPEDIGRAAAMLVRGDLPYATGTVLTLDGGMTLDRL
ncbi:MAG: 3-ketoacyl-ACP reductase [Lentisphaerae bacterium GWF2_44_16]|nr:MAG: 3-ketoacyl-ACP reductase [Lentisphaerae bacterium GWF2_44_16]